jgi:hypothetical protein
LFVLGRGSESYPVQLFGEVRALFLKSLTAGCSFLILIGCVRASDAATPGFLEGHLKIISLKEVELAEASPSKGIAENYADYPLIIRSRDGQKEIARVTADGNGNYRIGLPAGDYILDVQGRVRGHVRAKPQPFTVASNQTVHVDMDIDTGIR